MERFDIFNAKQNGVVESVETVDPLPVTNGHAHTKRTPAASPAPKRASDSTEASDVADIAPPPKKVKKVGTEDDATMAARLQAEEARAARPTRGGASRKSAVVKKKKTPKKKTSARITGSDDSGVDDEEGSGRKVNRETGFHKPMNLSPAAAEFFGQPQVRPITFRLLDKFTDSEQMSRPEVTKQIWKHIKANDLQDPEDKRFIICDDKMKALLKQDKVHMFTMTKLLNQHMYNPGE